MFACLSPIIFRVHGQKPNSLLEELWRNTDEESPTTHKKTVESTFRPQPQSDLLPEALSLGMRTLKRASKFQVRSTVAAQRRIVELTAPRAYPSVYKSRTTNCATVNVTTSTIRHNIKKRTAARTPSHQLSKLTFVMNTNADVDVHERGEIRINMEIQASTHFLNLKLWLQRMQAPSAVASSPELRTIFQCGQCLTLSVQEIQDSILGVVRKWCKRERLVSQRVPCIVFEPTREGPESLFASDVGVPSLEMNASHFVKLWSCRLRVPRTKHSLGLNTLC